MPSPNSSTRCLLALGSASNAKSSKTHLTDSSRQVALALACNGTSLPCSSSNRMFVASLSAPIGKGTPEVTCSCSRRTPASSRISNATLEAAATAGMHNPNSAADSTQCRKQKGCLDRPSKFGLRPSDFPAGFTSPPSRTGSRARHRCRKARCVPGWRSGGSRVRRSNQSRHPRG